MKDLCDYYRYDDKHHSSYHKVAFLYEFTIKKKKI